MIQLNKELRPDCSEFEIYLLNNGELRRVFEKKSNRKKTVV